MPVSGVPGIRSKNVSTVKAATPAASSHAVAIANASATSAATPRSGATTAQRPITSPVRTRTSQNATSAEAGRPDPVDEGGGDRRHEPSSSSSTASTSRSAVCSRVSLRSTNARPLRPSRRRRSGSRASSPTAAAIAGASPGGTVIAQPVSRQELDGEPGAGVDDRSRCGHVLVQLDGDHGRIGVVAGARLDEEDVALAVEVDEGGAVEVAGEAHVLDPVRPLLELAAARAVPADHEVDRRARAAPRRRGPRAPGCSRSRRRRRRPAVPSAPRPRTAPARPAPPARSCSRASGSSAPGRPRRAARS